MYYVFTCIIEDCKQQRIFQVGADKAAENTPNAPKFTYLPNLCSQAQKFGISMKKGFIGHPQFVAQSFNSVFNLASLMEPCGNRRLERNTLIYANYSSQALSLAKLTNPCGLSRAVHKIPQLTEASLEKHSMSMIWFYF